MGSKIVRRKRRSLMWEFYDVVVLGETAKCKFCEAVIKTTHGATTGLARHLESCHDGSAGKLGELRKQLELRKQGIGTKFVRNPTIVPLVKTGPQPQRRLTAPCWEFFVPVVFKKSAKCKICGIIIKTNNGTTTGMSRHLQSMHSKKLKTVKRQSWFTEEDEEEEDGTSTSEPFIKTEPEDVPDQDDDGGGGNPEDFDKEPGSSKMDSDPLLDEDGEEVEGKQANSKKTGLSSGSESRPVLRRKRRSPAWEFFVPGKDRLAAKCRICQVIVKTKASSTTGLLNHLKCKHSGSLKELRRKLELAQRRRLATLEINSDDDDVNQQDGVPVQVKEDVVSDKEEGTAPTVKNGAVSVTKFVRRRKRTSTAWKYYIPSANRSTAKCKICDQVISTSHGSTTGMIRHLASYHQADLKMLRRKRFRKQIGIDNQDLNSGKSEVLADIPEDSHFDDDMHQGGDDDGVEDAISAAESDTHEDPLHDDKREANKPRLKLKSRTVEGKNPDDHKGTCFVCHSKFSSKATSEFSLNEYRFLFTEMFEIPAGKSRQFLSQLEDLERWVALCKSCQDIIREGVSARKQINRLELQLEQCQKQIVKKVKSNTRKDYHVDRSKKKGQVLEEIQKFIRTKEYSVLDSEEILIVDVASHAHPPDAEKHNSNSDDEEATQEVFDCGLSDDDEDPTYNPAQSTSSCLTTKQKQLELNSNFEAEEDEDSFVPEQDEEEQESSGSGATKERVSWFSKPVECNSYQYRFHCPTCPEVKDYNVTKFALHLAVHQKHPYQCSICSEFLPTDVAIQENHWKTKHSDIPPPPSKFVEVQFSPGEIWKCESCLKGFLSKDDRDQHEQHCSPPANKPSRTTTKRDSGLVGVSQPKTCQLCQENSKNFAEWRLHRAIHHPEVDCMSCYYCDESFRETTAEGVVARHDQSMMDHMQSEHGTMKIFTECGPCGQVFPAGMETSEHRIERHGILKSEAYPCSICDSKYSEVWGIRRHMSRTHFQVNASFCEFCGAKFITTISMIHHNFKAHGIVAEGYEILKCPREGCSFTALFEGKLNHHVTQVHDGLKHQAFICRYCGKAFKNGGYFRQHEDLHKNKDTRPYQCQICGSSFAVKNYLTVHKKLIHEGKSKTPRKQMGGSMPFPSTSTYDEAFKSEPEPPQQFINF